MLCHFHPLPYQKLLHLVFGSKAIVVCSLHKSEFNQVRLNVGEDRKLDPKRRIVSIMDLSDKWAYLVEMQDVGLRRLCAPP